MTQPARPERRISIAATLAAVIGAGLILLSALVVVPPFTMAMLPLVLVASEMSPLVALADLVWCLPLNRALRPYRRARIAMLAGLVGGAAVAVMPLAQFPRVSAAVSEQLGTEGAPPRFSLRAAFAGLPARADVQERMIPYAADDGTPLVMRIYALPGRSPRPTVVVVYGGAWRAGAATQCANVSRALASHGFTVAAIDYRHAPAARYPAQVDDVNRSVRLLRDSAAAWQVGPQHMAILGRSSGGHLAELTGYGSDSSAFQAVIAIYAPFDLVQGYTDLPTPDPIGVRGVLEAFTGGTPRTSAAAYRAASPSAHVRPGLPTTLLIYGGRDHIVKPEFNRRAAAALRAARVPVVAVELPWAEHGFDMVPSGLGGQLAFNVVAEFLERTLRGVESPRH